MDNVNNLLILANNELESGNYPEAEVYFKKVLESQQSVEAWLGLGNTRLAIFYNSVTENKGNSISYIQSAFNCFERAKSTGQDIDEIEIRTVKTSFHLFKAICDDARNDFDKYKNAGYAQKILSGVALAALITKTADVTGPSIATDFAQKEAEKNLTANSFTHKIQAAFALKERAIPFVEINRNLLHDFINETSKIEYALQWHTTDEKEKKRILLEQERARRKVENNGSQRQKPEKRNKLNPWVRLTLWVIGILMFIRLLQVLF